LFIYNTLFFLSVRESAVIKETEDIGIETASYKRYFFRHFCEQF